MYWSIGMSLQYISCWRGRLSLSICWCSGTDGPSSADGTMAVQLLMLMWAVLLKITCAIWKLVFDDLIIQICLRETFSLLPSFQRQTWNVCQIWLITFAWEVCNLPFSVILLMRSRLKSFEERKAKTIHSGNEFNELQSPLWHSPNSPRPQQNLML